MKTSIVIGLLTLATQANATGFSFRQENDLLGRLDHLEAEIHFDGRPHNCLVDTGARYTIAKEALLAGNKKVGETGGSGLSGVQRKTDLVESQMQLGDWSINPGVVGRTPADSIPFDCIIGNDFYMHHSFAIDFTTNRFEDIKKIVGRKWPLNRYVSDQGGHFGFNLEIEGTKIESLFDTGANSTVFDINFVAKHPDNFEFIQEVPVKEGSNQTIKAGIYKARQIRFADVELNNVTVYVLSLQVLQDKIPGIQAILGLRQMTDRKWSFDQKNSTWNSTLN